MISNSLVKVNNEYRFRSQEIVEQLHTKEFAGKFVTKKDNKLYYQITEMNGFLK